MFSKTEEEQDEFVSFVVSNLYFVIPTGVEESLTVKNGERGLPPSFNYGAAGDFARHDKLDIGMTRTADKIIVALDVPRKSAALDLVEQLAPKISFFKVGLQLYTAAGPEIVREILATGAKVFLDLKLHDIPNTVGRAVESAGELGVQMLTIHLSGGEAMIHEAVAARSNKLSLLGVTVLTSTDEQMLRQIGIGSTINEQVLRLAELGAKAGMDGLVASPLEVKTLRAELGGNIKIVVPGVRPKWADADDQKRVMTPRQALDAGADYLVIGRPITSHSNPHEAATKVLEELSA